MPNKSLLFQQINIKIVGIAPIKQVVMPATGWVKAIRTAIGMSMQQLANKLNVSKQAVADIEKREKEGAITIKSLREVANSMDMELVYAFVPKDGSLEALVERKATAIATTIVMRTANTMQLEDQANSKKRLKAAIKERAEAIKNDMPKFLWD
jgi:predicted DNA-binding mobile mystery protein A